MNSFVDQIKLDYQGAELPEAERTMCDFAVRLTDRPGEMREVDVEGLRKVGFEDVAIHEIVQVTALFAYYNRLADGLGIDPEGNNTEKYGTRSS